MEATPFDRTTTWFQGALSLELHARRGERHKWTMPRFHYSRDLDPEACERRSWYAVRFQEEPLDLDAVLASRVGDLVEALAIDAMQTAGRLLAKQIPVKPLRPSAWCWEGTADALVRDPDGRLVVCEIKSVEPGIAKLLRETGRLDLAQRTRHLWQLAAYRHSLAERLGAELGHRLIFLPRGDGPVVELEPVLPTLDQVIERERFVERFLPGWGLEATAEPPRLPLVQRLRKKTWEAPAACRWCAYQGRCGIAEVVQAAPRGDFIERDTPGAQEAGPGPVAAPAATSLSTSSTSTSTSAVSSPREGAAPASAATASSGAAGAWD